MVVQYTAINPNFPQLRAVCLEPPIYLVPDFLSSAQCAALVLATRGRLPAVDGGGAAAGAEPPSQAAPPRTSCSVDACDDWCRDIHALVQRLTQQPALHMEQPTVTRYLAGQEYVAHHDAFPPGDPLACAAFGGNRICTVLVYLNDVAEGGRTTFHRAACQGRRLGAGAGGLSLRPKAGIGLYPIVTLQYSSSTLC
jgi:prolyl 4-hydroxylase